MFYRSWISAAEFPIIHNKRMMNESDRVALEPISLVQTDPTALAAQLLPNRPLPPVERWNPPLSGVMDLRIARDGLWHHQGRPIEREALVRLFASILRRDVDGQYYLVTPVEKWRIQVDDAPFRAVALCASGHGKAQTLTFTTNIGDVVTADADHPLIVEYSRPDGQPSPYLEVRGRLRALLTRAVFLELIDLGEARATHQGPLYGVWSQGQFFSLGSLDEQS